MNPQDYDFRLFESILGFTDPSQKMERTNYPYFIYVSFFALKHIEKAVAHFVFQTNFRIKFFCYCVLGYLIVNNDQYSCLGRGREVGVEGEREASVIDVS